MGPEGAPSSATWMVGPVELTIPVVTVGEPCSPRAYPMATTDSPANAFDESPSTSVLRPVASILSTARSAAESNVTTRAEYCRPPFRVTVMFRPLCWTGLRDRCEMAPSPVREVERELQHPV